MTKRELIADCRQFVERTYAEVAGRVPSKRAVNSAAKEIATALHSVRDDVTGPKRSSRHR